VAKYYHPHRPPQLPDSAEFMRLSPDGHPLWLNPEAGQYGIVFIDLPDGQVRHCTAAELQLVNDSQFPKLPPRQSTTSKEATVPRKSPTAKSSGGSSSSAKSSTAKAPSWRDLEGEELGRYLLEHKTISDKLHTKKSRHKGEDRETFIRRIYGLDES
jgi:hypothetical protein